MERVTFTCTAPVALLRWLLSDVESPLDVDSEFTPLNTSLMPAPGYTVTLTAFNDTSLTSTISRVAENGVMVTCLDPPNDVIGSASIQLAGEELYHSSKMYNYTPNMHTQVPLPPFKDSVTLLRAAQPMKPV